MTPIRGRPPVLPNGEYIQLANTLQPFPRPPLQFTDDGPGDLSVSGARHDNDHIDYRDIQILPTVDELLAVNRPTYMPRKDLSHDNFLGIGVNRHLDLLFRQLRCDSIESIRDVCYSAAQVAFLSTGDEPTDARHETVAGNRYFLYRNIRIEELLAHETKAMLARLSYHCPGFMRGKKMYNSGRFQEGMLVALLELDHFTHELSVHFMEVSLAQSTMSMDSANGAGLRAAVQLSFIPNCKRDGILQLCRHALRLRPESELVLVEFPKVLYAGFHNCLDRLQRMQESDVGFAKYIAPNLSQEAVIEAARGDRNHSYFAATNNFIVPPPAYATASGFAYNLEKIVAPDSGISRLTIEDLQQSATLESLEKHTTLDHGQAVAFRDSLMREFAFTQGPPGCGKTFLGVQLTKALLQSRTRSIPVLLVCLTNHALDNFLAELRNAGVGNLLRVGSGSKEEWTDGINLHSRKRKTRSTREEYFALSTYGTQKKEALADIDILCKAISAQNRTGTVSWHYIQDNLERNYPGLHSQFSASIDNPIARAFAFEYWSQGGDLDNLRNLHVELASRLTQVYLCHNKHAAVDVDSILLDISDKANAQNSQAGDKSVWNLPLIERQKLLQEWESEVDAERIAQKITSLYLDHQDLAAQIRRINNAKDVRTMAAHDIVGVTTTACAGRWDVLQSLKFETLICEEAGEVMEAHTLCSLMPTLQHTIFIGDPLQLRPEVNEQLLRLETEVGSQYRLDESLLERLMCPKDPALSAIPTSRLDIQRRMHPDIANIARITYPFLNDHESTFNRRLVHGLKERMYWWDHRVPELRESDDSKSHANLHEVEMVTGLVEYLLKGGAYTQGEIAVLTPYSGQLCKLNERLSMTCDIWLNDKDRGALLAEELLALGEEGRTTRDEVPISDMLRLTSVDNFQGEEAKVIILSTVRSGGRAGFLKTINRINVACSRAQEAFYIIGNSDTLKQISMWRQVIAIFGKNIGESITTYCHTHPEHQRDVQQPADFAGVEGCPSACGQSLACGHKCREKCHPPNLHERLVCQEECNYIHQCGHKCPKLCYQTCGKCELFVDDITLGCGHPGRKLCSGSDSECTVVTSTKTLGCGHIVDIVCGEDSEVRKPCVQKCNTILPCGHHCPGNCQQCATTKKHLPCTKVCGRQKSCGHLCKSSCHLNNPCPPTCPETCSDSCEHGPCKNRCSDVCDPCVKQPSARCTHETSSDVICCLPNVSLPCCQPCDKTLDCGHACPSFHGEVCPPKELCLQCITGTQMTATMLYMPECNHLIEVQQLDRLNCETVYDVKAKGQIVALNSKVRFEDLREPKCICGTPCPSVRRYSTVTKLAHFPRTLDLLSAKMGRKMQRFARSLDFFQQALAKSLDSFITDIRPNPLAATSNMRLLLRRDRDILDLHKHIVGFRDAVVIPFERSLRKLHIAFPGVVPSYATMFHTRFHILEYRAISVRIADNLKIAGCLANLADPSHGVQRQGTKMMEFVRKESLACMDYCQEALADCLITTAPSIEAELRLQQAQFLLLAKGACFQMSLLGIHNDSPVSPAIESNIIASLQGILAVSGPLYRGHKVFMETAKSILECLQPSDSGDSTSIVVINSDTPRQIQLWGQHELGGLRTCTQLHVFSIKSFPDGCPTCGNLRQSSKPSGAVQHLREADFLRAMRGISSKPDGSIADRSVENVNSIDEEPNSGGISPTTKETVPVEEKKPSLNENAKKELAAREKFLAAMRKI